MMSNTMIVSNQIRCKACNDSIFSQHVHNYVTCSCGLVAVDGGQHYLKRVGSPEDYEDLSITFDRDDMNSLIKLTTESTESGRNPYGVTLAVFRGLRDLGYEVVKSRAV